MATKEEQERFIIYSCCISFSVTDTEFVREINTNHDEGDLQHQEVVAIRSGRMLIRSARMSAVGSSFSSTVSVTSLRAMASDSKCEVGQPQAGLACRNFGSDFFLPPRKLVPLLLPAALCSGSFSFLCSCVLNDAANTPCSVKVEAVGGARVAFSAFNSPRPRAIPNEGVDVGRPVKALL